MKRKKLSKKCWTAVYVISFKKKKKKKKPKLTYKMSKHNQVIINKTNFWNKFMNYFETN